MTRPPAIGLEPRERWGEVLVDLLLAGMGVLLVAVVGPELDGTRPIGLWLLVAYTCWAVAVTLVLAAVVAVRRGMPTLEDASLDGRPALVLRSSVAPWWHANALDAGLAVLGTSLLAAAVRADGDWALAGLLPGAVGLWFAGRMALVLLGRRRRPALWLTDDELVVDSPAGRARTPLAGVATPRSSGRRLVVPLRDEARWALAPRPWRTGRVPRDTLVLDCSDTGHRAADVADWLAREVAERDGRSLPSASPGRMPGPTTARSPRSGPFREQ